MTKAGQLFEYILTHYRGLFAILFLLPVSVLYSVYKWARNLIVFHRRIAHAKHEQRVQNVVRQIDGWKSDGGIKKLCTARSGWKTMSELLPKYKLTHRKIDVGMYDILELSEQHGTIKVEPLATMGQISRNLISRGWTLAVLPELEDLTVGGLIMGFGIESSSHKYGLFQSICASFDLVTADGHCVRCSPSEHTDLYYLIPWSHGTLGFLVAAELKIIPAKKFIRVHYQPVYSLDEMVEVFEEASRKTGDNDFVEGLIYSRDTAVITRGTFTNEIDSNGTINAIGRWYKPWFYKHVETYLKNRQSGVEYIPLRHYYHRHTRSYFWTMEEIIPFGNHPFFRCLLGWALPPRIELLKYTETETTRKLREKFYMVQDMLMPIRYLKQSIQYFNDHFNLYPLWLSPMAVFDNEKHLGFVHPLRQKDGTVDEMYVDIGAYGKPLKASFDNSSALPLLEKFVMDHHGYQALYAKTTLSREEFRSMFDHSGYDKLREQLPYCKQAFDEVYDKVSSKGRVSPVEMRKLANNSEPGEQ